jgi:hypothetical protein
MWHENSMNGGGDFKSIGYDLCEVTILSIWNKKLVICLRFKPSTCHYRANSGCSILQQAMAHKQFPLLKSSFSSPVVSVILHSKFPSLSPDLSWDQDSVTSLEFLSHKGVRLQQHTSVLPLPTKICHNFYIGILFFKTTSLRISQYIYSNN